MHLMLGSKERRKRPCGVESWSTESQAMWEVHLVCLRWHLLMLVKGCASLGLHALLFHSGGECICWACETLVCVPSTVCVCVFCVMFRRCLSMLYHFVVIVQGRSPKNSSTCEAIKYWFDPWILNLSKPTRSCAWSQPPLGQRVMKTEGEKHKPHIQFIFHGHTNTTRHEKKKKKHYMPSTMFGFESNRFFFPQDGQ